MFSEEMICSLNDLELEVYKYVVRNADKVCYMRIREFADAAHVSTSTILRFCKKAGCDGYAEFKIRLRQHLEQAKQPLYGDNVFEKCGINRDGAGEVGKPRYFNGKRHF